MSKLMLVVFMVLGTTTALMASAGFHSPEIDANSGLAALTLVGSAIVIIRGRAKK
jgi:hypothetical protein